MFEKERDKRHVIHVREKERGKETLSLFVHGCICRIRVVINVVNSFIQVSQLNNFTLYDP